MISIVVLLHSIFAQSTDGTFPTGIPLDLIPLVGIPVGKIAPTTANSQPTTLPINLPGTTTTGILAVPTVSLSPIPPSAPTTANPPAQPQQTPNTGNGGTLVGASSGQPVTLNPIISASCRTALNSLTAPGCWSVPNIPNFLSSNYDSSQLSNSFNSICSDKCQAALATDIQTVEQACGSIPVYAYWTAKQALSITQALINFSCVKDTTGAYCLSSEFSTVSGLLEGGSSISTILSNTTLSCSKCAYSQIAAVQKVSGNLDAELGPALNASIVQLQGQCSTQYKAYQSSAVPLISGLAALVAMLHFI
ncbi:hypothetical protein HDV01_002041 [Terramyces sp. JEL0728]|nr:hypothetical protein HDV01_002041 [Terramyces sp. JEL0728]